MLSIPGIALRASLITGLAITLNAWSLANEFENVRVRLVNGSSIRVTIESIEANGKIRGSEILNDIVLAEIVGIDAGRPVEEQATDVDIVLRMGGTIPIGRFQLADERLTVVGSDYLQNLPLETVRAVIYTHHERVNSTVARPSSEYDSIIVSAKQGAVVVPGLLESVDETHATINYKGKSERISLVKVLGIVPADLGQQDPDGILANVSLVDGARINGCVREFRNGVLQLAISKQYNLSIPADQISKIAFQSDRVQYLSNVQPLREELHSQFAAARQWRRDTSLLGNPIRLKYDSSGRILDFEKGIGTRSFSSLVFSNRKKFTHFRTVVGIDVETAGQGDCEMVIEGDGIRLWSNRVRASDDPEPVVVEISGIDEVALIVLPGENFDLADHADWADARFTKSD